MAAEENVPVEYARVAGRSLKRDRALIVSGLVETTLGDETAAN